MGLISRAFRNVWRKKTRTLLVVILLGVSIAAIISVYSGVKASTDKTQETYEQIEEQIEDYKEHIIVPTGLFLVGVYLM